MELKTEIYQYLNAFHRGRNYPVRAEYLVNQFQIGLREINEIIRQLRKDGFLIGSAKSPPYGYYLPVTEKEVQEYLGTFKSELFDMLETYNRQKRAKKNYLENLHTGELFNFKTDPAGQAVFV